MTVRELIAELSKLDPELPAVVSNEFGFHDVDSAELTRLMPCGHAGHYGRSVAAPELNTVKAVVIE
jgi:hypothetical protein